SPNIRVPDKRLPAANALMSHRPAWSWSFVALLVTGAAVHADTTLETIQNPGATVIRAALAAGNNVNARDIDGSTALLYAAHSADLAAARKLLRAGADPNVANRYGVAPLHEAALAADVGLVRALVDAGAKVDLALPEGETPLMLASRTNGAAVVKL